MRGIIMHHETTGRRARLATGLISLFLAFTLAVPPGGVSLARAEAMPICVGGHRVTCVVDGDTFWLNGERIRILGLDAPEMGRPRCTLGSPLAPVARDTLAALLGAGGLNLERQGNDVYGRTLARVVVNGTDVADVLIDDGLGRLYKRGQKPWCG
jgi:endonuclease YncB( thermonuclease family)